jgi:hypothetical protein
MHLMNEIKWNDAFYLMPFSPPSRIYLHPYIPSLYSATITFASSSIDNNNIQHRHQQQNSYQQTFFRQIVAAINHFNETHGIVVYVCAIVISCEMERSERTTQKKISPTSSALYVTKVH